MKKILTLLFITIILISCWKQEDKNYNTKIIKNNSVNTNSKDTKNDIDLIFSKKIAKFDELNIDFEHNYNKNNLAFLGWAVIDIDNDWKDEFFISSWDNQKDWFFKYKNNKLINFIDESKINRTEASYWVISIDLDNDKQVDLIVARESWVYFYKNNSWIFEEKKLDIKFDSKSVPVDITVWDIDNDWDADLYISTFIKANKFKSWTFNKKNHLTLNLLLRNDGNLKFTDITKNWDFVNQNTFTSTFVNLDNDKFIDLVVSTNTDKIKIFKNNSWSFELIAEPSNYGFWMWLSISDIDNDWDSDLFFSNIWDTIPESLARWDLKKLQKLSVNYLLLENNWNFKFKDITISSGVENLWFGWGILNFDFNLDNKEDFLIMQNYIKWPFHKFNKLDWSVLVNENGIYKEKINDLNLTNKNFWFSSLVLDIDWDFDDDIVYLNIDWKSKIMLNNSTNNDNIFKIILPDNTNYIWSKFELKIWDSIFRKSFISKQWILTDQKSSIIFSLGNSTKWELTVIGINWDKKVYNVKNRDILILN